MGKKVILSYGTFDLFHIGHLKLIQRLAKLGDKLIIGISTDDFNRQKNKTTVIPFEQRLEIVKNIQGVDAVIAECSWSQKEKDIVQYNVSTFAMGDDWKGKFDSLKRLCNVVYLPRTKNISSTKLKKCIKEMEQKKIAESLKVSIQNNYIYA
jgi:glycerol-3-phosphate cytidylyltransferase